LQTFVWKAEDENDDRLQFDVSYRREGETAWKVLKRGMWDPIFVWDTTSVPDGTYLIKVSASDAPSNSPGAALIGELESVSFDVDNTAPKVEVQAPARSSARTIIAFTVRDEQSAVQRVEYSLDASRWRLVYPKDGIPDSRREEFEVALDDSEAARNVIIRATDTMNNVATAVAEVKK
jgi:flavin-binding protein dodecin